ncbi:glycoside hydrolase family 16 [Chlorella sorokiniana]|uniref:Glycoside hydrolase family 16 n=1 Tax=Chlorella sorokiniana TaxID=3076 RepID=A0A2P6U331_CHLSO|nr:glycoside hydrolase family 16 [Chlorella sorokiniana]|eukprot:PRW60711.1 glycoside hydrolase family 16 [Chlorella sorokiniana]
MDYRQHARRLQSARGLLALLGAALLMLAGPAAAADSCIQQLDRIPGATTKWVDPDTPPTACAVQMCTDNSYDVCSPTDPAATAPQTRMQLVFSDEFNSPGRKMGVDAADPRWTADNLWYLGTFDEEVYTPEQVTTTGGAAVITMDRGQATGLVQHANGTIWNVTKEYKSGFFSSWNKFCYTGGYIEAGLQFPGDDYISGFWPAFWLMGNLGRPGYLGTTTGMWPYTYSSCGGDLSGLDQPGANKPQTITACPDPPGFDRTKYGLLPGVGRGAPEIDMVEMKVPPSINKKTGEQIPLGLPRGGDKGQHPNAFNSMTLQLGPLLPNGTTWNDPAKSTAEYPQGPLGDGIYLPQGPMKPGQPLANMWTHATYWKGEFAPGMMPQLKQYGNEDLLQTIRPGNLVQDSVSVMATITPDFFTSFHKFGLDWKPGEYVRWYIDGFLVYEINKEALRAQTNSTGYTTFERLIPKEAMFIIFNFAMSNSFTAVDIDRLQFPAQYKIDYVRLYQDPAAINVGCSPPDMPTEQYIACNRDTYVVTAADQVLVPQACQRLPSCRAEVGYEYLGGNLIGANGQPIKFENTATPQECCQLCAKNPACGAYVWNPYFSLVCVLKSPTGWTRTKMQKQYEGIISGVVLDAGSLVPRGSSVPSPPPSAAEEQWRQRGGAAAWAVAALLGTLLLLS